jgi:hypothetical protein
MPMRQLAKSTLSLGWALSLLGAKQAYGLMTGDKQSSGDAIGRVAQAAVGQLDESMKRIHRSTNTVESRMVDMAFSFMNPGRWLNTKTWNIWSPEKNCDRASDMAGKDSGPGSGAFDDASQSFTSEDGAFSRGAMPDDPS